MEIPTEIINGVNPKHLKEPLQLKIRANKDGDCLHVEKRKADKGGEFEQITLSCEDKDGTKREVRYLFTADLVALAQAYGSDSKQWIGKLIQVDVKQDGKFLRIVLSAVA